MIKKWVPVLEHAISEYHAAAQPLGDRLSGSLVNSLTLLERMVTSIESYLTLNAPSAPSMPESRRVVGGAKLDLVGRAEVGVERRAGEGRERDPDGRRTRRRGGRPRRRRGPGDRTRTLNPRGAPSAPVPPA